MTDPKNPAQGDELDDLDALLDNLGVEPAEPLLPPPPPVPVALPRAQMPKRTSSPTIPALGARKTSQPAMPAQSAPLANLFDDFEPMPTRVVDMDAVQKAVDNGDHELPLEALSGAHEMPERPTQPPPSPDAHAELAASTAKDDDAELDAALSFFDDMSRGDHVKPALAAAPPPAAAPVSPPRFPTAPVTSALPPRPAGLPSAPRPGAPALPPRPLGAPGPLGPRPNPLVGGPPRLPVAAPPGALPRPLGGLPKPPPGMPARPAVTVSAPVVAPPPAPTEPLDALEALDALDALDAPTPTPPTPPAPVAAPGAAPEVSDEPALESGPEAEAPSDEPVLEGEPELEAAPVVDSDEPVLDAEEMDPLGAAPAEQEQGQEPESDEPALETAADEPEVSDEPDLSGSDEEQEEAELAMGDDEDSELTLEVSDEEDEAADEDRGAQLAAMVTSRKQFFETSDALYAANAQAEARARLEMLASEASVADTPARSAEMLCLAAEISELALGERDRSATLLEQALETDPESPFALRGLRRFALAAGDTARALELCDRELELSSLSEPERLELRALAAELASREGGGADRWQLLASEPTGLRAAVAGLFLSGLQHDPSALGEALSALGNASEGALSAAASLARARLAEGSAESDTALAAAQSAVQRDPTDVGSWFALARLGLRRESAPGWRDALAGIARAGEESAVGSAVRALWLGTQGVLSDALEAGSVSGAGVEGWLTLHALRDAGLDTTAQRDAALAAADDEQRVAWLALGGDLEQSAEPATRFWALHRAPPGDAGALAQSAAALVDEPSSSARLRAALLAQKDALTEAERLACMDDEALAQSELAAVLRAVHEGADQSALVGPREGEAGLAALAALEDQRRTHTERNELAPDYAELARRDDAAPALRHYASRIAALLSGEAGPLAAALREEAALTQGARAATLDLLSAALESGENPESLEAAERASEVLPTELAVAELRALRSGTQGGSVGAVAALLTRAGGDGAMGATVRARAALSLLESEPEAASVQLAALSKAQPGELLTVQLASAVGAGPQTPERVAFLRTLAEGAASARSEGALTAFLRLALACEGAGQFTEAAQALTRARTLAPSESWLQRWEERLWLRAGMFTEVAERSFDALKEAETDQARTAAYERLAELDSVHRRDVSSAVLTYQAILDLLPGHAASQRTLERYFIEQGRLDELLSVYDKTVRHAADPEDALALAHAASRIAVQQAEGDPSAAAPWLEAAAGRGARDVRLALSVESEARHRRDPAALARANDALATVLTSEREQAAVLVRAAEALLRAGQRDEAIARLERALALVPGYPTALHWLAVAYLHAERHADAATALQGYAASLRSPAAASSAWLEAALLWHDKVADTDKALAAYREVAALEPGNDEAFARGRALLAERGETADELAWLQGRLGAPIDESAALPLWLRVSEVAEALSDLDTARGALEQALALEPEHLDALRAASRLADQTHDFAGASEMMITLARVTTVDTERLATMFRLGELYDDHLTEPRRAEAAYKRVLQLKPGELKALSRLANLFARTGDGAQESQMLRQLVGLGKPGAERRALQLRLAVVLSEKLDDNKGAEEVLEQARREAPTDLDVLRAFARLYVRQQNVSGLNVLLDRAAAEVRRTLDAKPTDAVQLELLTDILKLRGRVDGARVVAALAHAFGVRNDKLLAMSRDGTVPGGEGSSLTPEVLELLAPPTITLHHRELLRLSSDLLESLAPLDTGALGAEKLGSRPHPLAAEAQRLGELYNVGPIELYVGNAHPLGVLPLGRHPAALLLPLQAELTPQTRFLLARAVLLLSLSLPALVRIPPRELTLLLSALMRQFQPMFTHEGVDPGQLDELGRKMLKVLSALPKARHAEMAPHAFEVASRRGVDGDALAQGTIELGNRLAVLATGEVEGALLALCPPGVEPARASTAVPAAARLVRVAMSERFIEARHASGADRRGSRTSTP